MANNAKWIVEHLPPQYSISTLESNTTRNYQKAINFYDARLKSFGEKLSQEMGILEDDFFKQLNNDIERRWDEEIRWRYWAMVDAIKSGKDFKKYLNNIKNSYDKEFLTQTIAKYKAQYDKGKGGNPASLLGNEYEDYINTLIQNLVSSMAEFTNAQIQNMIQVTGTKTSKSVATAKEGNIRPDIIFSMALNSDYVKEKGVLYNNGIAIELQEKIDLDVAPEEMLNELAKEYNAAGLYGFSLKVWKNSNNKKFMDSTPLKNELSEDFSRTDSKGSFHNWEVSYITAYMLWKVSNNILNFTGPTDIGLITGNGFEGFNTWLGNHMFYMKVQVDNIRGTKGYSARPSISDPGVYILNFIHNSQKINHSIKKSKKGSGSIIVKSVQAS